MSNETEADVPGRGPSPGRKWFVFLLGFPVSLALGWVFQVLTNPSTYAAADKLQRSWYNTVSRLSPVALVTGYVDDVLHVARTGNIGWDPPAELGPATRSPEQLACDRLARELEESCKERRLTKDGTACVNYDRNKVAVMRVQCPDHYHSSYNPRPLPTLPKAERPDWRKEGIKFYLSPMLAVARTWNRLTYEGGISYFLAIVMLVGGLLGFMLVHVSFLSEARPRRFLPDNFWVGVVMLPLGIVAGASVVCFVLKYIMLGALALFGWITGLAGLCCAATGTAGYVWWISHKFAQYSIGKVVAPKA
ncbi:MAG: hypothetical protein VX871_06510 [Pseudomonadota bacterium]|nr:hypothetical protein [Pseudomonadota bacterium]